MSSDQVSRDSERNNNRIAYSPCNMSDLSGDKTAPESRAISARNNDEFLLDDGSGPRDRDRGEDSDINTETKPANARHVTFRILKNKSDKKKKMKEKAKVISQPWPFLLRDFTQYTTLHGIRFITLETRFIFRRIFWVLLVLVTLGIFVFYVCDRVTEFLKFKKNISVEENYVAQMPFPSVTFCNQNRIRLTAAAERGWYDAVAKLFPDDGGDKKLRKCQKHEFTCRGTDVCIPQSRTCDAYPDCRDSSDEANCDNCPRILVSGPGFNNTPFLVQPNTFAGVSQPIYVSTEDTMPHFFYHDAEEAAWLVVTSFGSDDVKAKIEGSQGRVPFGVWPSGHDHGTFSLECQVSTNRSDEEKRAQKVSMARLYKEGKHETDVFIENCFWKGGKCDFNNFKETITDLGVCYTFAAEDMYVESSGPGHGLTLYLNIEQYEYTKDPGKGVGIKVLFHEPGDKAMMEETGIAISPGLYSLLAIEKTEITNLQAPWGNCSEWPLHYFDKYSMSTCKMDRDNEFARENCNCRNADMPEMGEDDEPVCTIEQFSTCLIPKITKARKTKDYYECKIPCEEAVYVPSLSFASISVDADTIKSRRQEAKMAALEAKLTRAREITYRLADDKYRETLRVLSIVYFRSKNLIAFLNATESVFHKGKISVIEDFDFINSDCKYLLKTSRWLQSLVGSSLMPSLQNFQTLLQILVFQLGDFAYLEGLPASIDQPEEERLVKELSVLYQSVYIEPLTVDFTYVSEFQNETVNSTVQVTLPDFQVSSNLSNYKFDFYAYYVMLRSRLYTVINSVDMATGKLIDDVKKTILNLPAEVEVDLGGVISVVSFNATKQELDKYVSTVSYELALVKRNTVNSFKGRISSINSKGSLSKNLTKQLEHIIELTNKTMQETVQEAAEEYKDLASLLSPKCEYESNNLKASFVETQDQVINRMTDMRMKVQEFATQMKNTTRRYIHSHMSLNDLARGFDLSSVQNSFNAYTLAIENLIAQKIVTVKRLMGHGKSLEELSAKFAPKGNDTVNKSVASSFGFDVIQSSNDVTRGLRDHVMQLEQAISDEKGYLHGYAQGNILNEEFFKKNYLQLDLFYKTLTDKKVKQQKAYEYPALLSEVGGLMGLLLGASLITIFEVLDLLMYNGLVKCCDRKRKRKNSQNSPKDAPVGYSYVSPNTAHAMRRKRLVPLASMDPMEGVEIPNHCESSPINGSEHPYYTHNDSTAKT